jgi:hypothetical protein
MSDATLSTTKSSAGDATRAGDQDRVMQPSAIERVRERAHDVFLADQFGKPFRPPFARKDLIRHWCRRKRPAMILADASSVPPRCCMNAVEGRKRRAS